MSADFSAPASWIPARWEGGPLELARRPKVLAGDASGREAIANWYDTATFSLLEGSPVNCLLVTWSAGAGPELEQRQQAIVKTYTSEAHRRGITVLGLVYAGSDPSRTAVAAASAGLDGLVLDGQFPSTFADQIAKALRSVNSAALVIPIAREGEHASARTLKGRIVAVEGISPSARNLADMGIRSGPSSETWIQSNAWLVRSFRVGPELRSVWISYRPESGTALDYAKSVADAALAGGRWIVGLDDRLRVNLWRKQAAALDTWHAIGAYLRFAEDHAEWRSFEPYGNVGIIVDGSGADSEVADEYLKLLARRQTPYRIILREQLSDRSRAEALAGLRAVLATLLDHPTEAEKKLMLGFAESGGVVIAGPSFGDSPRDERYVEIPLGKGRLFIYKEPDPESVARDMMKELLSFDEAGIAVFNVPTLITYASCDAKRLLVQFLNYSDSPASAITLRVSSAYKRARLFTPDGEPANLAVRRAEGKIDVTIPKLTLWGGVLLE